jgi:hypothetical protein
VTEALSQIAIEHTQIRSGTVLSRAACPWASAASFEQRSEQRPCHFVEKRWQPYTGADGAFRAILHAPLASSRLSKTAFLTAGQNPRFGNARPGQNGRADSGSRPSYSLAERIAGAARRLGER